MNTQKRIEASELLSYLDTTSICVKWFFIKNLYAESSQSNVGRGHGYTQDTYLTLSLIISSLLLLYSALKREVLELATL
ncbi:MAG: hypothetical protein F7B61_01875 [Caldisphaeraceae archaeon]|nr:hypothetical protein [Caldisphaeraceae archaeon]